MWFLAKQLVRSVSFNANRQWRENRTARALNLTIRRTTMAAST